MTFVNYSVTENVAVVEIDNPPVNALSPGVSQGINQGISDALADPEVKAIVLMGAGRGFIAGADIRYFGKGAPPAVPGKRSVDRLDETTKPLVAAIHGFALGGGFETALACNYRIAARSARIGLPEILIGVLPAGTGTQRLTRLIGPKAALEMILSGRHVPADEARQLGAIDLVVNDQVSLRDAAIRFAQSIADVRPLPVIRKMTARIAADGDVTSLLEEARKEAHRKFPGQPAPLHCITCVEAALSMPYEDGIRREIELFRELEYSPQAKALQYAFFSERAARRTGLLNASASEIAAGPVAQRLRESLESEASILAEEGASREQMEKVVTDFGLPLDILGGGGLSARPASSRKFDDEEILYRLLFGTVNEACKILDEKKAQRASDIDVMWLYGFGFPRYRGGPMFWADTIGVRAVHDQIVKWHREYGDRWKPSTALVDIASNDGQLRLYSPAASPLPERAK